MLKNDSSLRWLDVRYIISNGVIYVSFFDVSIEHEHQLAYERYQETINDQINKCLLFIEADLSLNHVDRIGGTIHDFHPVQYNYDYNKCEEAILTKFWPKSSRDKAIAFNKRDNLLVLFSEGKNINKVEWSNNIPEYFNKEIYMRSTSTMILDPYSKHVKLFSAIVDITKEKEEYNRIKKTSETDSLSGLLNRVTIENKVNNILKQFVTIENNNVFIILDIDNFKMINDKYGHAKGDDVIVKFSKTLKETFRDDGFVSRIGGDEFVVFIPSFEDRSRIRMLVELFLSQVSEIEVGDDRIHCSAGVAYSEANDDYNSLYKKADIALYQVKRTTKNNYAVYNDQMTLGNYKYEGEADPTLKDIHNFSNETLHNFIKLVSEYFTLILSFNATKDQMYTMESNNHFIKTLPKYGSLNNFLQQYSHTVDAEKKYVVETFYCKGIIDEYNKGNHILKYVNYQVNEEGEAHWVKTILLLYENDNKEVCGYSLTRVYNESDINITADAEKYK